MSSVIEARFGDNVRKVRLAEQISQEELAARSGLHRTYIGAVERGERNISLLNIVRVARALRIPAGNLMNGVDE